MRTSSRPPGSSSAQLATGTADFALQRRASLPAQASQQQQNSEIVQSFGLQRKPSVPFHLPRTQSSGAVSTTEGSGGITSSVTATGTGVPQRQELLVQQQSLAEAQARVQQLQQQQYSSVNDRFDRLRSQILQMQQQQEQLGAEIQQRAGALQQTSTSSVPPAAATTESGPTATRVWPPGAEQRQQAATAQVGQAGSQASGSVSDSHPLSQPQQQQPQPAPALVAPERQAKVDQYNRALSLMVGAKKAMRACRLLPECPPKPGWSAVDEVCRLDLFLVRLHSSCALHLLQGVFHAVF